MVQDNKRVGQYWKGKRLTEEHRKHMSLAHKGKTLSQETRKKISRAIKKWWKNNRKQLQ